MRAPFALRMTLLALLALGGAVCGYNPHPKDGVFPCSAGCPSGYVCGPGNTCWREGSLADASPGRTPDAGSEVAGQGDGRAIEGTDARRDDAATDRQVDLASPDSPEKVPDAVGGIGETGGRTLDDAAVDVPVLSPDTGIDGAGGGSGAGGSGGRADADVDAPNSGTGGVGGAMSMGGTGGAGGTVGSSGTGGFTGGTGGTGGAVISGGAISSGGATVIGGTTGSGGSTGTGGVTETGGASASGGATASGGTTGSGGATSSGGTTGVISCVGQPDFTPCTVVTTPDRHYDICVEGTCVSPGCGDTTCNVPGPHFPLADTGQRLCYGNSAAMACPASGNAFFGQDAQYGWDTLHPGSERFTRDLSVSNQPVVSDNVTGLSWQGCSSGSTGNACDVGAAAKFTWPDALAYCDGLNWGGHQDWHLPDLFELQSILDFGSTMAPIDTIAFPATPPNVFWSSSSAASPGKVWVIPFNSATYTYGSSVDELYVRCVRSGPASGLQGPRYSRNTSVTDQPVVADNVTGLSWQGCSAGLTGNACAGGTDTSFEWDNALGYCEGLDWGGHQDWRLPNAREIRSILNLRTTSSPVIDTTAFPPTNSGSYWSSSSVANGIGSAWLFYSSNGAMEGREKTGWYIRARCVRTGS